MTFPLRFGKSEGIVRTDIAEVASLSERRQRTGPAPRGAAQPGGGTAPSGAPRLRVAVVHADAAVRDRLAADLGCPGVEVVAAATADAIGGYAPDVVVLLHGGGGPSAVELFDRVRAARPAPALVVVAVDPRPGLLRRAVQSGASGFVDAASPPAALREAVASVADGRPFLDPAVGRLVVELLRRTPSDERPYGLTRAELDVVALLPQGLPNRLIAAELGISENTVKTHLRAALQKLGVRDRAQAAALVLREGIG